MSKSDLFINKAFLAVKDKLPGCILEVGKIENDHSESFLFFLIELRSKENSAVVGKIVSVLKNSVRSSEEITPDLYEASLSAVNQMLDTLSRTTDNLWIGKLNALIGIISHDEILISQSGTIGGYIFRKNKISSLCELSDKNSSQTPARTFTDIISGQILPHDRIVFGNNELFNRVSVDRLRTLSQLDDIYTSVFELKRYLRKARIESANSIFLSAVEEPTESPATEVVYLDEPEETVAKMIGKKVTPVLVQFKTGSQSVLSASYKNGQTIADRWHQKWLSTYQPRGKEILQQSREKFSQGIVSGRKKFDEINKKNGSHSRPRIKANSYLEPKKKSNFSAQKFWQKASHFSQIILDPKNRRRVIATLLILVVILGYAKININNSRKEQAVQQVLVSGAFDKAQTIFTQAKNDRTDGEKSLDKFYEALALAETAKADEDSTEKANSLIKQINIVIDDATKTVRFYNSTNYPIGDQVNKIILAENEIYGLNNENKIYSLDVRDKQAKLVGSLQSETNISDYYYSKSSSSIFFNASSSESLPVFDLTKKITSNITTAEPDKVWKGPEALATYSSNIYTLDAANSKIWKYATADPGYSKATAYVTSANLKDAVDLAIDGNVFVLKQDGTVLKFTVGSPVADFTLKNIPAPNNTIGQAAEIFTDDSTLSIFILDKKTNRILKFDKTGEFNSQFIFDGVTLDSFAVDAQLQKIWGLSGGKIYEGNL